MIDSRKISAQEFRNRSQRATSFVEYLRCNYEPELENDEYLWCHKETGILINTEMAFTVYSILVDDSVIY